MTCTAICRNRITVIVMAEERQTTARLEARLPNDVHALLNRAAEIEGRTLTDFVVRRRVKPLAGPLKPARLCGFPPRTSGKSQERFSTRLSPPLALKKAFQQRRELPGVK